MTQLQPFKCGQLLFLFIGLLGMSSNLSIVCRGGQVSGLSCSVFGWPQHLEWGFLSMSPH